MNEIKFVCICITSVSSCIVSSWPLSVLVFLGLMPHVICLLNFNILSGGGCMLIDFGQFSLVENKNDLELDFKVFFFTDSYCSDIVHDESN